MKNLFYLLLCLIAGTSCSQADPTKPWNKGAFETRKYRNLFAEIGYKQADSTPNSNPFLTMYSMAPTKYILK